MQKRGRIGKRSNEKPSGGPTMAEIISDNTYNLLAILLSKLEGLEAYDTYLQDADDQSRQIIEQIRRDDEKHAEMLRDLVDRLVKEGGFK